MGKKINKIAEEVLTEKKLQRELFVDVEVNLDDVSEELIYEITKLEPYGAQNPEPVLKSNNISIIKSIIVGKNHLKLQIHFQQESSLVTLI